MYSNARVWTGLKAVAGALGSGKSVAWDLGVFALGYSRSHPIDLGVLFLAAARTIWRTCAICGEGVTWKCLRRGPGLDLTLTLLVFFFITFLFSDFESSLVFSRIERSHYIDVFDQMMVKSEFEFGMGGQTRKELLDRVPGESLDEYVSVIQKFCPLDVNTAVWMVWALELLVSRKIALKIARKIKSPAN